MKRQIKRGSAGLFAFVAVLVLGLSGCGTNGQTPISPHKTYGQLHHGEDDLHHSITEFVTRDDFAEYNANADAFQNAHVTGIYPYSMASTKRIGKETYVTTIEGQAYPKRKDPYAKYLQLTIKAHYDTNVNEENELNTDGFTKTTPYNKWFKIVGIKKLAAYNAEVKENKDLMQPSFTFGGSMTLHGQTVFYNEAYEEVKPYFSIDDPNEFYGGAPQSGLSASLKKLFEGPDFPSDFPAATKQAMANALVNIHAKGIDLEEYFKAERISKSYYALSGFANAADDKPNFILIFRDANTKDTRFHGLTFVKSIVP